MFIGIRFGSAPDFRKDHDFQFWAPLTFDAATGCLALTRTRATTDTHTAFGGAFVVANFVEFGHEPLHGAKRRTKRSDSAGCGVYLKKDGTCKR
jgi:hypothetical protein